MTDLPAWVHQLVDGLLQYDAEHPKLFSDHAWGLQRADCPCPLLAQVPEQAKRDARMFMEGRRQGYETAARAAGLSAGNILAGSTTEEGT